MDSFIPIINPPQAAILAVGGMRDRPLVRGGKVAVTPVVSLTLVADHRVLDGVLVAGFLRGLKEMLENPTILNPLLDRNNSLSDPDIFYRKCGRSPHSSMFDRLEKSS